MKAEGLWLFGAGAATLCLIVLVIFILVRRSVRLVVDKFRETVLN
jgi:hypothetical protein